MAILEIRLEIDAASILTRDETLAIGDRLIERAGLKTTPDLGAEHGNDTGVRVPVSASRWAWGQFRDGYVQDPLA